MRRFAALLRLLVAAMVSALMVGWSVGPAVAGNLGRVNIAYVSDAVSFLPIFVMKHKKLVEKYGYDATYMLLVPEAAIAALLKGDIPFAAIASAHALKTYDRGERVLIVGNIQDRMTIDGVVAKASLRARGIDPAAFEQMPWRERVRLMKGMRIGVYSPGSMQDMVVRFAIQEAGFNPDQDFQIVSLQSGTAMVAALRAGRVDGFAISPPNTYEVLLDGSAVLWLPSTTGTIDEFNNWVYTAMATSVPWAERNPAVVRAVVQALDDANRWIRSASEAELIEVARTFFPTLREDTLRASVKAVRDAVPEGARVTEQGLNKTARFLAQAGFLTKVPDLREGTIWTNRFLP